MSKQNRKVRNLLIDPLFQFKFSGYLVLVLVLFTVSTFVYAHYALGEFLEILYELSEVPETAKEFANEEIMGFFIGLVVILVIFLVATSLFVIVHTHRILGAGFAIKRHISSVLGEKDFTRHINLRKKDYLKDIAQALNEFSDKMRE